MILELNMHAFVNNEPLEKLDPEIRKIINLEAERQNRKLILIPSESSAPAAVRESLGSILQNIYAEGYPPENSRKFSQLQILDIEAQLLRFRRYSDPRYYKGVEFIDVLEELARRRCAELFANNSFTADNIFVNVQPLSGAPANNAVYQALIEPGDVVLGMNLFHGGHLTHGSSVNRSGKLYTVFHYGVSPETEKIDYDQLLSLAKEKQPKIIITGYSSYPWAPDWGKFKEIAKSVNSYLFADVSHIAGLIAAEVIPSPVGFADVITFTTHKTLCGPRGACILSFDEKISSKIDRAVFPGEQGGPHAQVFAGMATTFMLARSGEFKSFQRQVVKNCKVLTDQLIKRDIRIAYGGTNTHLINIDCKSIKGNDGTALSGDMAARILDNAGIVVNANTIPGDQSAFRASGIRMGTPWVTQRGLQENEMIELADIIADLFTSMKPYTIESSGKSITRAKVDYKTLEESKLRVRKLCENALETVEYNKNGYPYFYFSDDYEDREKDSWVSFLLTGEGIRQSLNYIIADNIENIESEKTIETRLFASGNEITCLLKMSIEDEFVLSVKAKDAGLISSWLRGLSDGYIHFDEDVQLRIPGPFFIEEVKNIPILNSSKPDAPNKKPYFIGISRIDQLNLPALPSFKYNDQNANNGLKRTRLYEWHSKNGGKIIPFAGWEMPVWYSSVVEEHMATRNSAGLFDVSHMGVFQAEGIDALAFLDSVCANDISTLSLGESCYTHFLSPEADVIDDLLVYHHNLNEYLLVVNAANDDKDWSWLNAVKSGSVQVDIEKPSARCYGSNVVLRNLQDPSEGSSMMVDLALQGPLSRHILINMKFNENDKQKIASLKRTQLCHAIWEKNDLIISRTGYTGEKLAYEIFIHPDLTVKFWEAIIKIGLPLGVKPCGLGARDSLRTEAGLPLYGHEMGGTLNLGVAEAGFSSYVKTYKPWFIGRSEYIKRESSRKSIVVRFRFEQQRVRMAHLGDPVLNDKGKVIGVVTSCAIDKNEYLTGQAYIETQFAQELTEIYIYQGASELKEQKLNKLSQGDRTVLPSKAVVVSRFAHL